MQTQDLLWIGAFRYYLGRMTYAVGDFTRALIVEWPNISDEVKSIILRELREAFERDSRMRENPYPHTNASGCVCLPLGMDCDRREWEKVLKRCK